MIGPYPTDPVVTRLAEIPSAQLRYVGNVADLQTALTQKPRALPAAYVCRQERAQPSKGASGGVLVQQMQVDLIVVLYVQNHASAATGAAALAQMTQLVNAVRGKLLNWRAVAGVEPLRMNASRDESFNAGLLISQELYRSDYRIEVRP